MSKRRSVSISAAELSEMPASKIEGFVCAELRRHGIPVRGMFDFKGVKTGVLRVRRGDDGSGHFDWWPTTKDALDDGVVVADSPDSQLKEEVLPHGTLTPSRRS